MWPALTSRYVLFKLSFFFLQLEGDQYPDSVLDLYTFVLVDSLKKALRCRNVEEFDICHELYLMFCILLYLIECICWLVWRTRSSVIIDADIVVFYFSNIKRYSKCIERLFSFYQYYGGHCHRYRPVYRKLESLSLSLLYKTDFFL